MINYLEYNYNLKYIESIDIDSKFSINIKLINLGFSKKEILFEVPKSFVNIPLCKKCRFPVRISDLKSFDNLPKGDKQCRNCEKSILKFRFGRLVFLKNRIIYFK
ncbi:hypothetical protein KAT24_00730 [Candidatus Pacearchaeota archaeon]|nr:hypothetical protein [Candidatus Pacearchaeota archaeon]